MKVVLIARSTLFKVPGGDTIQITQTALSLRELGIIADVKLANENINYADYNLLHFFNITRPADILKHISRSRKPYAVSTILCDYSEYDKSRGGAAGILLSRFSNDGMEYMKSVARFALGKDKLVSPSYLWRGQYQSIIDIIHGAAVLLPNSESEYRRVSQKYTSGNKYHVVPNGIDPTLFNNKRMPKRDDNLVLCVARIEGIKNQLNLIKALNNTRFKLLIIGAHAPNQHAYYQECVRTAAANIEFIAHLPQADLIKYYQLGKVHILPSWFETTGLSTIEAAAMGCNVVITDKGDTREYFEDHAFYCDPSSPQSIYQAVERAGIAALNDRLQQKILNNYTWKQAAIKTFSAYQTIVS